MGKGEGLREYKESHGGVQRKDEHRSEKTRNTEHDRRKKL